MALPRTVITASISISGKYSELLVEVIVVPLNLFRHWLLFPVSEEILTAEMTDVTPFAMKYFQYICSPVIHSSGNVCSQQASIARLFLLYKRQAIGNSRALRGLGHGRIKRRNAAGSPEAMK
jgi:hypothetical protein